MTIRHLHNDQLKHMTYDYTKIFLKQRSIKNEIWFFKIFQD